ncbi:hypothetical protein [Nonomuraea sp. NPDC003214]
MAITTVRFTATHAATFHLYAATHHASYRFGDQGKIHVQPAYFGMPDRLAVTISLGRPGDTSGYGLTGLRVGGKLLTGVVMCTGLDLRPGPHFQHRDQYPLGADDLDDATRTAAADLLADVAQHFHDIIRHFRS